MHKRQGGFSIRIYVPDDLRDVIGRREVWRSTQTDNPREAKLRASLWQRHFGALFLQLRRTGRTMAQAQLSALVTDYRTARLSEVEERLAYDLPGLREVDRDAWQRSLSNFS